MIPWNALRPNEHHPDWRADLNEHNLFYYITTGPSQLKRGLDSPMLELAHERQFAISQLGTRSIGFEADHSIRVQSALQLLDDRFITHSTEERCPPKSPHIEALMGLRRRAQSFTPLPPLDLLEHPGPKSTTLSPTVPLRKPTRSPLALQELMNPVLPPSSTLKRKASQDFMPSILADDELENVSDTDRDLTIETTPPIEYHRAKQVFGKTTTTRTHRGVRMRKSRSTARNAYLEEVYDADQLEKDGQLLLNLSRSRGL
ncbi:hypothetical protein H2200_009410 [Cladophialophora chaetospira]|uniref:Uncharacterized protein n=1 Tax=Cladophialophora chaetospira TaxID=386627 RepID=A0AA38X421_9EURO|nr:hypothetical protein H2200_009410 [Cladophialophora chaetospira]